MRWRVTALLWLGLMAGAAAHGHAHLASSLPAADAVLEEGPAELRLSFTEELEVAFSLLKVVRLDADVDLGAANARLRLNGLAAQAVNRWLPSDDTGPELLAFDLRPAAGRAAELSLGFEEALAPGHYVLMWRVLSVDTHITEGHLLFSVVETTP